MKKKKETADARVEFRCSKDELEEMRAAAFEDGLNGNASAWIKQNIRRILRERREAKQEEKK